MLRENGVTKDKIRKREIFLHIFLIFFAIAGSIYNIQQLQTRKDKATNELVSIFTNLYTEKVAAGVEKALSYSADKEINIDPGEFVHIFSLKNIQDIDILIEKKKSSSADLAEQKCRKAIGMLYSGKIDNPFLFGFKNISKVINSCVARLLLNNVKRYNIHNGEILVQENLPKYFAGDLQPHEYLKACDMFIFVLMSMSQEENQKNQESDIIIQTKIENSSNSSENENEALKKKHEVIKVTEKNYMIGAALLGRLSIAILGRKVSAEEIYRKITGKDDYDANCRLAKAFDSCLK